MNTRIASRLSLQKRHLLLVIALLMGILSDPTAASADEKKPSFFEKLLAGPELKQPKYLDTVVKVPEPPARGEVFVDFSPLFETLNTEMTEWYTEPSVLQKVALSANVFSPMTRMTLATSIPPIYAAPTGMELEEARGRYVSRELGIFLMDYLADEYGLDVIPAVSTRLMDDPVTCRTPITKEGQLPPCASQSELERLMSLSRSAGTGPRPSYVPDAYLAIEQFGLTWDPIEVIVEEPSVGVFSIRPRHFDSEKSICAEKIELDVASFKLYADLVNLADGALISRMTERRAPQNGQLTTSLKIGWNPVKRQTVDPTRSIESGSVKVEEIVGWEARSAHAVVCEDLQGTYARIRRAIDDAATREQRVILKELLKRAFTNYAVSRLDAP